MCHMEEKFINKGKRVSIEVVNNLEEKLNVRFPFEYKRFFVEINGGEAAENVLELRKFDLDETNINCYVTVDHFFSLDEVEEVWNYTKNDLEELSLFAIAEVRGGMLICCQQSEQEFCEIIFYDNNFGVIKIADTLRDFIDALISEGEVDYKKYGIG